MQGDEFGVTRIIIFQSTWTVVKTKYTDYLTL